MFTKSFVPAINKDGFSKLTFTGYETKEGVSEKTGKEWSMFRIIFRCMGRVRGVDRELAVTTGFTYNADNILGKTLSAMGFKESDKALETDEDGFGVESETFADDGFTVDESESQLDILGFLDSQVGTVYLGKVFRNEKGYLTIDVETLEPLTIPTAK